MATAIISTTAQTHCQDEPCDTIVPDTLTTVDHQVISARAIQLANEDSVAAHRRERDWWTLFKKGELNLSDSTVEYPKFMRFCVGLYNWGNEFFNGTDPEYLEGTGRRWKAFLKSDNWVDSYAMNLGGRMPIRIMSDIYCNAGGYLQYMAVSVGYSLDLSNIIGNKAQNHSKLEFSFSCQRFSVDAYFNTNTGGSYLRTFGKYKDGHLFKKYFPGVTLSTYGIDAYYFINHRRYSQGAAYNFSRIQRKSAGSWIVGFSYSNIDISMDFTQLPYPLMYFLTVPAQEYRFHYNAYTLAGGYGYNLVFGRNWLFNITVIPIVGLNYCYMDSTEGKRNQISLGFKGKSSLTYNLNDFFIGVQGRIDGHWYRSYNFSFFSSIENLAAMVGVRF